MGLAYSPRCVYFVVMANRHEHNEFLEAIGLKVVRDGFPVTPQRLYNWRNYGIPFSQRVAVARFAIDHGVVPPEDFLEPIRTGIMPVSSRPASRKSSASSVAA